MTSTDAYGTPATAETGPEPVAYTLWAVLRRDATPAARATATAAVPAELAAELDAVVAHLPEDVTLRGTYDASGLRADADVIIWLTGPTAEGLQAALRTLRRTELLGALVPTWNALGVHRPAEFTARHLPAFMTGKEPKDWLTVYPFVRSYEWYLMEETERRTILAEHGKAARTYPDVRANTIASFGLNDYEWILAFEADDLHRIVDLMRDMRATRARLHVREETPFYTGPRVTVADLVARQR